MRGTLAAALAAGPCSLLPPAHIRPRQGSANTDGAAASTPPPTPVAPRPANFRGEPPRSLAHARTRTRTRTHTLASHSGQGLRRGRTSAEGGRAEKSGPGRKGVRPRRRRREAQRDAHRRHARYRVGRFSDYSRSYPAQPRTTVVSKPEQNLVPDQNVCTSVLPICTRVDRTF